MRFRIEKDEAKLLVKDAIYQTARLIHGRLEEAETHGVGDHGIRQIKMLLEVMAELKKLRRRW